MAFRKHGAAVAVLSCATSCGGAVPPRAPGDDPAARARQVNEPVTCIPTPGSALPLTARFGPDAHRRLEGAMVDGIVMVRYACNRIRLAHGCRALGSYAYASSAPDHSSFNFADDETVRVNLPSWEGDLDGSPDGSAVPQPMTVTTAGVWTAPAEEFFLSALDGRCGDATHFVYRAHVGTTDGPPSVDGTAFAGSCGDEASASERPTPGCRSIVRLELRPLNRPGPEAGDGGGLRAPCPAGWKWGEGICSRGRDDTAHLCAPDDREECEHQCAKGSAASCYNLGQMKSGLAEWIRGCDGGEPRGCHRAGDALAGAKVTPAGMEEARGRYARGCALGYARACRALADVTSGPEAVLEAWDRGCALGDRASCRRAGRKRLEAPDGGQSERGWADLGRSCAGGDGYDCWVWGRHLRDGSVGVEGLARSAFRRGCESGHLASCNEAGEWLRESSSASLAELRALFERACPADGPFHWDGCLNLGRVLEMGTEEDKSTAVRVYERVCEARIASGCRAAAAALERDEGAPADPARVVKVHERGCLAGDVEACEAASRGWRGIDPQRAAEQDRATCSALGHAPACARAKGR